MHQVHSHQRSSRDISMKMECKLSGISSFRYTIFLKLCYTFYSVAVSHLFQTAPFVMTKILVL